jgi:ATP-dependent RNA helicase DDX47/RRP3
MHKLQPSESSPGYALIICPTRELCIQINEYLIKFREHGLSYCTSVVLHGGSDTKMRQVIELIKKPSIVIGTPGRILDHLSNTKGFNLDQLAYLVLDEADKLLNLDFEKQIN